MNHTIQYKHGRDGAGKTVSATETIVGVSEVNADLTVSAATYDTSAAFSVTYTALQEFFAVASQPVTLKFNGTNEVQSVTFTGTATGGTYTLTWSGQTTTALAYNASVATIQAALRALSNVGGSNVLVGGGPLPGTPISVTFQEALGRADQAALTATSSLTGSSPGITIGTTTAGVAPSKTITLAAGIPAKWTINDPLFTNPFAANLTTVYATNTGTVAATVILRALTN